MKGISSLVYLDLCESVRLLLLLFICMSNLGYNTMGIMARNSEIMRRSANPFDNKTNRSLVPQNAANWYIAGGMELNDK